MKGYTGLAGLEVPKSDFVALSYTGDDLTGLVYRKGGATGEIMATFVLAYVGSQLVSVTVT